MEYYNTKLINQSFDDTINKAIEELKKEGFGILTEIDVKDTLKKKLDVDFRKYKILGACNPPFAYKALQTEDKIGVMLPCNVILQEKEEGKTEVSIINPLVSMQTVKNPELETIAGEVSQKLSRVLSNI